jgi:hypothetical protein
MAKILRSLTWATITGGGGTFTEAVNIQKQAVVDTTTGAAPTLTSADFGKIHIYSHASTSANYTLPAPVAGNIIEFVKTGTGTLTITAPASTTIDDSAAAGTKYCSDTGVATVKLLGISATKWITIAATNVWTTT